MRLAGKVAIISGAASGMGAATARMFAREGANVVIAYRFSFATLGRIAPEVLQRKELKAEWADDLALMPHVEAAGYVWGGQQDGEDRARFARGRRGDREELFFDPVIGPAGFDRAGLVGFW